MKPIKAWAVLTQNGKNIAEIFYLAAHDMPMAIYRDKQNRRGGDVQAYQWVHVEIRELERPTRKNQRQAILSADAKARKLMRKVLRMDDGRG